MDSNRTTYLFYRHFDGTATPEERLELAELLQGLEDEIFVHQLMEEAWETFSSDRDIFRQEQSRRMLERILGQGREIKNESEYTSEPVYLWRRISIAVSVVFAVGIAFYYSKKSIEKSPPVVASVTSADIQPGGNRASLTLSDGHTIELDHVSKGVLTRQGAVSVIKTAEGHLTYQVGREVKPAHAGYNVLATPRGGQYHLVLPDGSNVWLNAASSIRYPTTFEQGVRRVQIKGEAYFEINKMSARGETGQKRRIPFVVKVNNMEVEVLGTHFNINAYAGSVKTTLLEGSVRIKKGNHKSLLQPGQQADVNERSAAIQIKDVDVRQSIAWKDGYFRFEKAGLEEIMRELAKWYDVQVRYDGKLSDRKFTGEIPRSATLSQVLEILEISKIHLDVAGKELLVKQQ